MLIRPARLISFAEFVAVKPSNESVASSAVLQDDDDLQFSIGASETWAVRWVISATFVVAGGLKVAVAVPSGGASLVIAKMFVGAVVASGTPASEGAAVTLVNTGANTLGFVEVEALVVNGATAGSVKLQWCQSTSDVTPAVFLAKSFMVARKK